MITEEISKMFGSALESLNSDAAGPNDILAAVRSCLADVSHDPALRQLINDIQNDRPLAMLRHDLGSRKRVVKLAQQGDWTVELATPYLDSAAAIAQAREVTHGSTVATKFVVASVGQDASCTVQVWTSNAPPNADPVAVRGSQLIGYSEIKLDRWECWMPTSPNQVVRMPPDVHRPVWLLFIGPQFADYIHGYETRSGKYTHSSFASLELTSNDLLTVFMREYSAHGIEEGVLLDGDAAAIAALAKDMFDGPALALNSRWRLCQVLAEIDPEAAVAELSAIAKSGNSLAGKARIALDSIGISQ